MKRTPDYRDYFNAEIERLFHRAARVSLRRPRQALSFLKMLSGQKRAARRRQEWQARGVNVPPVMIASITSRCNLSCPGCYAQALRNSGGAEMSTAKLRAVIAEAHELGISIILLAGGEPLVRPEVLGITRDFPEVIFPVFTNGLLIDETFVGRLDRQKNLIPVISLEGYEEDTDGRRGQGVFEHLRGTIQRLSEQSVFLGVSLTVTRSNLGTVTGDEFIRALIATGCQLFFFVEYVPVEEETTDWTLSPAQKADLIIRLETFRARLPGLFVGFPGDEEEFGGCLAAGRGFVHVSAEGKLEPCPFAPYSDADLTKLALKDALRSEFLKTIRENHDRLRETRGGCALWTNRAWLTSLLPPPAPSRSAEGAGYKV